MSMDGVEAAVDSSFPAPEAEESKTNAPATSEGGGDLRSEMVEFLKSEQGEGEEKTQDPAPEAKASEPTDAPEEGEEVEAKAEESDEDPEADAKSGDEPEPPKKKSGWQKSKEKIAKLEAVAKSYEDKVASLTERESKWEHVTQLFQGRLEEAEERAARAEARLQELGAGPDPRESQVMDLERRLREQQAEIDRREREFAARQQRAEQQAKQQRITAIQRQVAQVAEANGIEADDLAVRAAGAARAAKLRNRAPPSLEDVAAEMVALRRIQAGTTTERQAEVSQSAPRPVRGSAAPSPTAPSFGADTAGGLAYLKSQGLI